MPSIGRQFRKGEGVPRKDLAMAALGLGESREKSVESREGNSGEIGLSEAERESAVEEESKWDRDDMIVWAKTIGDDEKYNEAWVDATFEFLPDGTIRSKVKQLFLTGTEVKEIPPGLQVEVLVLSGTQVKEIPPGLQVEVLDLIDTQVKEIPPGLQVEVLYLSHTQVKEIPPGLQVEELYLRGTQVREIPPGLQVEVLVLSGTQVKEIPTDKGAIQKIYVGSAQAELKASAEARGIEVETL